MAIVKTTQFIIRNAKIWVLLKILRRLWKEINLIAMKSGVIYLIQKNSTWSCPYRLPPFCPTIKPPFSQSNSSSTRNSVVAFNPFVNSTVCNNKIFGMLIGNIHLQFFASVATVFWNPRAFLVWLAGCLSLAACLAACLSHSLLLLLLSKSTSRRICDTLACTTKRGELTHTIEYSGRDKLLIRTT